VTNGTPRRSASRKIDSTVSVSAASSAGKSSFEETMIRSRGWMRRIVVDPNSAAYTAYNMFYLLVLVHDVLHIPFTLAWDLQMVGLAACSAWISCLFWTLDVGVSCITGYSHAGRLEMRLPVVVWRYAKTWLVPDVALNICDWLGLITASTDEDSLGSVRLVRFMKLGKLLRLIGLLRMIRAVRVVDDFIENRFTGAGRLLLQCFAFACSLLLISHLIGCAWYTIGRTAPSDTGMRWIDLTMDWNGQEVNLLQQELLQQYFCAVHWSMAQIVGGNMNIIAYNSCERVYNMLCMASGLIFGCSIVSMLSTSLVQYQVSKNDQIQKIRQLRRFLMENDISRGTATLVQQQASVRLSTQSKLREEDVHALQLLSASLRSTLRHERFIKHLSRHTLFRLWNNLDSSMVHELCMEAMGSATFTAQDHIFEPGVKCNKAYCLVEGQATYVQEPATAPVIATRTKSVGVGQWICEAALWSHWVHVGRATACAYSQVLSISTDAMLEVLQKRGPVTEVTAEYGRHFHRRIAAARPPHTHWPTDLEVPFTEFSDLMVSMDPEVQVTIGLSALGQQGDVRGLASLQDEVLKGKSCVLMNAQGEIERLAFVVVLQMTSCHGKVLAELGKVEGGVATAGCQLPGLKQEVGEMMHHTLVRLLARFQLQSEHVELTSIERQVKWKNSKESGVRTKYIRSIHHVTLLQEIPIPTLTLTSSSERSADTQVYRFFSSGSSPTSVDLPVGPVYSIPNGERNMVYTWLDLEDFEHLRRPAAERALTRWLRPLGRDELEEIDI